MNPLSERELRMNQQAAMAAASVLSKPVEAAAPSQPPITQRLQELATLPATGVISDAEYTSKREQIISEL
jgi:hypothetical protein